MSYNKTVYEFTFKPTFITFCLGQKNFGFSLKYL